MREFFSPLFLKLGPELVVVFVQGSGAKRCWLINMQAELPSLRCWLLSQICPTHLHTALRAHTQTHRCMQRSASNKPTVQGCICRRTHAQVFFFWANPQACMKNRARTHSHIGARILTHTLTCSSLHLFSCVLFSQQWFPLAGLQESAAPGEEPVR